MAFFYIKQYERTNQKREELDKIKQCNAPKEVKYEMSVNVQNFKSKVETCDILVLTDEIT